jgi:hypothetical protein
MELLVNWIVGWVIILFDGLRALLGWGGQAVLTGAAVAVGAYAGTRMALTAPARGTVARRSSSATSR